MMESLNNGKTITEAFEHDITGAIGQFEYFAGTAFHLRGEIADFADSTMLRSVSRRSREFPGCPA
jgi:acyl-CoA reductase-like NAD-dependent aldehyde dehydrogenase